MAINTNPGKPIRQLATYNASGNFVTPAGTNVVFVSVRTATGGGGQAGSARYGQGQPGASGNAAANGIVSSAWVQVIPGITYAVVVGAAGAGATTAAGQGAPGNAGAVGGTSSFDGAIFTVPGSAGGTGGGRYLADGNRYTGTASNVITPTGGTTLGLVNPGPSTIPRTGTIANQTTGGSAGGNGGSPGVSSSTPKPGGNSGVAAQMFVYG
jgi:hypothetical protein